MTRRASTRQRIGSCTVFAFLTGGSYTYCETGLNIFLKVGKRVAFDAFVLNAVAQEIENKIIKNGGRLNKIYQLNPREILLFFKGEVPPEPIFISIHTQRGRINFTRRSFNHPLTPPPFCMLARKRLANGLLASLEQPP